MKTLLKRKNALETLEEILLAMPLNLVETHCAQDMNMKSIYSSYTTVKKRLEATTDRLWIHKFIGNMITIVRIK